MSQSGTYFEGSAAPGIETLSGNSGGPVGPDLTNFNVNVVGAGSVNVAGNAGTNTLTISVSGSGLTWNTVAGTTQAIANNNGYIPTNGALTTFTLPATSVVGDYVAIVGSGAGGWLIAQGAGQIIRIGANASTLGAGGSVASFNQYDSLEMICTVANTTWICLGAPQTAGFTIV